MKYQLWQLVFCNNYDVLNSQEQSDLVNALTHIPGVFRFANAQLGSLQVLQDAFCVDASGDSPLVKALNYDAIHYFDSILRTVHHNRLALTQWLMVLSVSFKNASYNCLQRLASVTVDHVDIQPPDPDYINELLLRAVMLKSYRIPILLIEKLIDFGANINAIQAPLYADSSVSLLRFACIVGQNDCVRLLLQKGATPYESHRTQSNHQGQITAGSSRGFCPSLLDTCRYDRSRCLESLLDAGVDCDAQIDGDSLLYNACLYGAASCVGVLINVGVDINAKGDFKRTPLFAASDIGHSECCALLIQAGAQLDCRDYNGNTALMRACVKGHVACVSLLLAAGADVNIINGAGKSALMQLCQDSALDAECRDEIVSLLMAKGARNSRGVGCFSFFFTKASRLAESQGYLSTAAIIQNSAR